MADSDLDRAMADGARRSALAHRVRPAPSEGFGGGAHRQALRSWGAEGLPVLWARHKGLIVGIGLFLLFDLIVGIAVVTMGTHF